MRSQHCQRNWDLEKLVPDDDIKLLITAATQCPSKQNIAYYKLHVIMDRSIIEQIHTHTKGFTVTYGSDFTQTNSQVLANSLFLFEDNDETNLDIFRNQQTYDYFKKQDIESYQTLNRDKNMAIGIASGYVNLVASLLGYSTGFCACFDPEPIKTLLNLSNNPLLLMGVGHNNHNLNRRVHHKDHSFIFPSKTKQPITVKIH